MKFNEVNAFGFKIANLLKLKRQLIDFDMKALGLLRTQWQVFFVMNKLGFPCSQKKLLQHVDIDQAHLARTLEQLEYKQWVTRTQMEGNRRALLIHLTDKGRALMKQIKIIMIKEDTTILKGFKVKEKMMFYALLEKVEQNLLIALKQGKSI